MEKNEKMHDEWMSIPKNIKLLISSLKPDLLKLREEAHRFSLQASRRRRKIK
jgi:hypothetical protein